MFAPGGVVRTLDCADLLALLGRDLGNGIHLARALSNQRLHLLERFPLNRAVPFRGRLRIGHIERGHARRHLRQLLIGHEQLLLGVDPRYTSATRTAARREHGAATAIPRLTEPATG